MKNSPKYFFVGLLLVSLNACSAATTVSSSVFRADPEIFQVGELEVRLYQDREKMSRDLPLYLGVAQTLRIGTKRLQILGYYDKQNKRIFSVNDARVLLHEIKHYLEPHWRHDIGANYLDVLEPGIESARLDYSASVPSTQ
jgi:hypothetical protein